MRMYVCLDNKNSNLYLSCKDACGKKRKLIFPLSELIFALELYTLTYFDNDKMNDKGVKIDYNLFENKTN